MLSVSPISRSKARRVHAVAYLAGKGHAAEWGTLTHVGADGGLKRTRTPAPSRDASVRR